MESIIFYAIAEDDYLHVYTYCLSQRLFTRQQHEFLYCIKRKVFVNFLTNLQLAVQLVIKVIHTHSTNYYYLYIQLLYVLLHHYHIIMCMHRFTDVYKSDGFSHFVAVDSLNSVGRLHSELNYDGKIQYCCSVAAHCKLLLLYQCSASGECCSRNIQ